MATIILEPSNFVMVSHEVLESQEFRKLTDSAKTLFLYLCKYRNRLGDTKNGLSFWRTDNQILKDTGLSRNTLKRARHSLIEAQFLWFASYLPFEGKNHGPRYYIIDTLYKEVSILDTPSVNFGHRIKKDKINYRKKPSQCRYPKSGNLTDLDQSP